MHAVREQRLCDQRQADDREARRRARMGLRRPRLRGQGERRSLEPVVGSTIAPRIRISRFHDENGAFLLLTRSVLSTRARPDTRLLWRAKSKLLKSLRPPQDQVVRPGRGSDANRIDCDGQARCSGACEPAARFGPGARHARARAAAAHDRLARGEPRRWMIKTYLAYWKPAAQPADADPYVARVHLPPNLKPALARTFAPVTWRREMDSNQRYGFPYCLARSQDHRKSTSRLTP